MNPMTVNRRLAVFGGALALSACGTHGLPLGGTARTRRARPDLKPLSISADRLMRITACVRPFRREGPRLDVETLGDKRVVHCYGHGGSGWSLAWGSADAAAERALADSPKTAAVIGAGAIGLATASVLQRAGVKTTIYAKELPSETRSARATGVWSPDSRIAMTTYADASLADALEGMARRSYAAHQHYIGLAGSPVEFLERFYIPSDAPPQTGETGDFLYYAGRLRDLTPRWKTLDPSEHPFPTGQPVRRGFSMTFNVAEYAHRLMTDFLLMGGAMRRATFQAPQELAALPEPVIINCTGYGARALWGDESLTPVRGQIGWLAPQPDRLYGVYHKDVLVLSRRDGFIVQYTGPTDLFGMGVEDETPDRAEFDDAVARVAPLFDWSA